MIPFLDLRAATNELQTEINGAVDRVVNSGWYIGGPEVEAFEAAWADYVGAKYCVGVANGLDALHLALRAVGVVPGDEVILASNGYIATHLAISMIGAIPVPVEPDPATHNLDPGLVEAAITPRTKVILPTHLYGQPADLGLLGAIADAHGLILIDDAAQAHGSFYRGVRVGGSGMSLISCWSFYPSKNLGALGDAGAVTTDEPVIAARVRRLGNYGSSVRYVNEEQGINSRLDPIHAAVLAVKLPKLNEWNARRAAVARYYTAALCDTALTLPHVPTFADPAWHLYVVQSPNRDRLAARLAEAGVQTLNHYPIPPHLQQAYAAMGLAKGSLPVAERLAGQVLSLPIGPHLGMDNAERVADAVRAAL